MPKKDIRKNMLQLGSTLRDVMAALNQGVYGIIFIADDRGVLKGIFTDGDVRRALLSGAELSSEVDDFMKRDFVFVRQEESRESVFKKLNENVRHIPILDNDGRLVDFISWAEIWRLPIMEPELGGNEFKYVSDCITSNWISSQGSYVKEFEKKFAAFHDVEYALTTSSGTTALHLALVALGIGEGDEVIVPDSTFIASANVVRHAGAQPVFVDVSPRHWTIDVERIEASITEKTKAIMPVHLYGHPCDMDPILEIVSKYKLFLVEDCAESLGARYKGRLAGTMGDIGCFSFFSNKVITTGEGGMVITDDKQLFEKMTLLRDHGMSRTRKYWHEFIGFNYRMTNLQAAVGLAQMEQIAKFLKRRQTIANCYKKNLEGVAGVVLPVSMAWAENIYWLYTILIDESVLGISRDDFILAFEQEGVETRPFFYPMHLQPPYANSQGHFPVAELLSRKGISLPSSNGLADEDIERVCNFIKNIRNSLTII